MARRSYLFVPGLALVIACTDAPKTESREGETEPPAETDTPGETGDTADSAHTGEPGPPEGLPDLLQLTITPRNLLVISVDTLRRDAVGAHSGGPNTPNLDALMAEGVTLSGHRACSAWTYPGAICAMTGAPAEKLGFVPSVPEYTAALEVIPDEADTLASVLQDQGYQTGLVAANGYLGVETGLAEGFASYWVSSGVKAEGINAEALELVDGELDLTQPWMLHVHYIDPHSPYAPPDAYLEDLASLDDIPWDLSSEGGTTAATNAYAALDADQKANLLAHLQVRYTGEVRYVDDQIALLLAELDGRGMLDDTLLVFWTDHGEQLFEHGARGHAASLFGQENDGVSFLWARGLSPAVWSGLTSNEDLPVTALAMMGLPAHPQMTGAVAGSRAAEEPVFGLLLPRGRAPVQTVSLGDLKMMYAWDGRKTLYERGSDPEEITDLYDSEDPRVEQLWELLVPRVTEVDALLEGWTPASIGP